jgi:hypothetical protein
VRLLTEECLLPAVTMIPCNVALVNDVWGILNLHDYTDRWSIYSAFRVRILSFYCVRSEYFPLSFFLYLSFRDQLEIRVHDYTDHWSICSACRVSK